MQYVTLGNTGLMASRLGLGCEILGGTDWGNVDQKQTLLAVHRAMDLGINVFDTADVYGLGKSEEVLSYALGSRRHEMIIISKCGVNWKAHDGERAKTFRDCSPKHIIKSVEGSLKRLRIDAIPIYLLHWPDPNTPIEDSVEALCRCQKEGKIRHYGISNFDIELLKHIKEFAEPSAIEVSYSLVQRSAEFELIPYANMSGWGVICYGVLAQGLLTGKYSRNSNFPENDRRCRLGHFSADSWQRNEKIVSELQRVASKKDVQISQVALSWTLYQPGISVALVGARSPSQVDCNVASLDVVLNQQDKLALKDACG